MLGYIFFFFFFVVVVNYIFLQAGKAIFSICLASVNLLVEFEQQSEVKGTFLISHLFKLALRHTHVLHLSFL